jgi:DNA-binding YbaB/EbfC family protein
MQEFQGRLDGISVDGRSGGGLLTVTLSGKGDLRSVKIDPSLVTEDVGVLEDLIVAAHADAKARLEVELNQKMQEMTAGLPLPPGMKFPF